jgi:hypothetical protein
MSRESDPLPYVQVDRAVKPKAALLANALGVTTQHALGSLVEWWELCGDPRELEDIVRATPPGAEPAVVLDPEDAAARFLLASGKPIEPVTLVRLGLLEPAEQGRYRVRGMSRYFAPVKHRIQARQAAKAGGLARAGAPRIGGRFAAPDTVTGAGAPAGASAGDLQPPLQPPTSRPPADDQPRTSRRSRREPALADIGQRSSSKTPVAPRDSDALCGAFKALTGQDYLWQGAADGVALAELLKVAPLAEVLVRWRRGLEGDPDEWASCRTVTQLRRKWNDLAAAPKPSAPVSIEHRPSRML